jgi:XRE family transcriptional regulator, regulator of sulfur utilization
MAATVGPRIRALRVARDLSLRELADRSGVSAPMLSQVERGETSPTLAVAGRIAEGFGLSLSQLLRLDEGPPLDIVRAGTSERAGDRSHGWELLSPAHPGVPMAVSRHLLAAGAATGDAPMHGPGAREFALVEQGVVTLEIAGEHHRLETGDAVTFDADLEHRFIAGDEPAVFLSVVSAGLRAT